MSVRNDRSCPRPLGNEILSKKYFKEIDPANIAQT
jgi:hypothetical protein